MNYHQALESDEEEEAEPPVKRRRTFSLDDDTPILGIDASLFSAAILSDDEDFELTCRKSDNFTITPNENEVHCELMLPLDLFDFDRDETASPISPVLFDINSPIMLSPISSSSSTDYSLTSEESDELCDFGESVEVQLEFVETQPEPVEPTATPSLPPTEADDVDTTVYTIEVILYQRLHPETNTMMVLVKWFRYDELTWEPLFTEDSTIDEKGIAMQRHQLHQLAYQTWRKVHSVDHFVTVLQSIAKQLSNERRRDIVNTCLPRITELSTASTDKQSEMLDKDSTQWFLFNMDAYLNFVPSAVRRGIKYNQRYAKNDLLTICMLTVNLEELM